MSDPNQEFEPPPPPSSETARPTGPTMSAGETLTGIFFEPGRVFESMRERPRFLVATTVCILFFMLFTITFYQKVGYDPVIREAVENGPRAEQMSPEQKEAAIRMQSNPIFRIFAFVAAPIIIAIIFAAGAAIYLLGSMLLAKQISYKQALSIWAYSSLPPFVLAMILNVILVFLKSPDDYDVVSASRRGLVKANLAFLTDAKAAPVINTLLGSLDLFAFYGLFLAALGFRKVGKISSGLAWAVVLSVWVLGVVFKMALAGLFGQAM
jgi:hypothetical protein